MKKLLFIFTFLGAFKAHASDKDSTYFFNFPDSVKAVQFMTEITIHSYNSRKGFRLHLNTGGVSFEMKKEKNAQGIFTLYINHRNSLSYIDGINTHRDRKGLSYVFPYNWKLNETYKFLIAQASDSASGITIYSGYVFLPGENKWKLIGSNKVKGWNVSLKKLSLSYKSKKDRVNLTIGQTWAQRSNGSWKNLKGENLPNPVINLAGHLDSVKQRERDIKIIEEAIASGKTDVKENVQGVYYKILKEGTGNKIGVTDTVSVYYHLHLLNDTLTIDEAKNTPARFPLNRLIRGWSIGVPLIKVGGKIRLVIPSDLAYSIRTRSAKIPPNSILVFTIEVLDAKSPD